MPKDLKNHDNFIKEIDILKSLDHPNIMKIYEFYEDPKNYHLVTEYCSGGELFDYIVAKKHLSEKIASSLIHQLLTVIIYSHNNGIVHRDLKPENIVLDGEGHVKLVDFGLAHIKATDDSKSTTMCGTPEYLAPEILLNGK